MFKIKNTNGNIIAHCNSIAHLMRVVDTTRMNVIIEDTDRSLFAMTYGAVKRNIKSGIVYNVLNRANLERIEFLLECE